MDIYASNILDHYKQPRNRGSFRSADFYGQKKNSICGDKIKVSLKMSGEKIKAVKYLGDGCAISQAAMSLLTEFLPGKSRLEVLKMDLQDIENIMGIKISAGRQECAFLGLKTIQEALRAKN